MGDERIMVGRVLRATTASFSVGCRGLITVAGRLIPEFGGLVKALGRDGAVIYGLTYNVTIDDDAFVRLLVAAGLEDAAYIEDQRQNRQVPVIADILTVGGQGAGQELSYRLPAQPPGPLDEIYACHAAEIVRFTHRNDWLRTVLAAKDAPSDQLITASLRAAAAARPLGQREAYLVAAGRELARQMALDLGRLDGILGQLYDDIEEKTRGTYA